MNKENTYSSNSECVIEYFPLTLFVLIVQKKKKMPIQHTLNRTLSEDSCKVAAESSFVLVSAIKGN